MMTMALSQMLVLKRSFLIVCKKVVSLSICSYIANYALYNRSGATG